MQCCPSLALRHGLVALAAALASCGANGSFDRQRTPGAATGAVPTITLASTAFVNGHEIPRRNTCDGIDERPVIRWGTAPKATKSFALVLDDADAPGGTFRHWGVVNIPAQSSSIGASNVGAEVMNDFGKLGYNGPCPPKGGGVHRYEFKLFALDNDRLNLSPRATVAELEEAAAKHAVGRGEMTGTYVRE